MRPPLMSDDEITTALAAAPAWQRDGEQITRTVTAPDFRTVIAWVVGIADAAELLDHHPDLDIRWTALRIAITTHDRGGLTVLDFRLAEQVDAICS